MMEGNNTMYARIDVSLTRQTVLTIIQKRLETGESVTQDDIAAHMNCHPMTVFRAIRDLKRAGKIRLVQRGNPYQPTLYAVIERDEDAEC
jgi:DNA-binding GntR family transcriptional regulator